MAIAKTNVRFWHDNKEGSGTSVADSNGGGAGTLSASPTWTTTGPTGISTNCVSFAATVNSQRIDTVGASPSPAQIAFCYTQWFWNAGGDGAIRHMMGSDSVTGGTHALNIYKDSSDHINGRLVNPGVGNDFLISGGTDYCDSAWHLVIFQRDSSGNVELFVDGTSQGTTTDAITGLNSLTVNIGNAIDADGSTDFAWGGKLSQSILFDAPLNSTERAALYAAGAGVLYAGFFPSSLPKPLFVRQAVKRAYSY